MSSVVLRLLVPFKKNHVANNVKTDQSAPQRAVWSASTLFVYMPT